MGFESIRSLVRNTGFLASAGAVNLGARVLYLILAARLLGPERYAVLAYAQSFYIAFLPVALFGLHLVMVRAIGADRAQAPRIAASSLAVRSLTTAGAAVLCAGAAWATAADATTRELLLILVAALIARSVTTWTQSIHNALEATHHTLQQTMLFSVVELSLAAGILLGGGGIHLLVAAHATAWSAHALFALHRLDRLLVPTRIDWSVRRWLPLLLAAIPFFVGSLSATWATQGPIILFRTLSGDDFLAGQFALAMQALIVAAVLPDALAASALPLLARSAARADGKDLLYASAMLRATILLGGAAGFLASSLGPWLLVSLFGSSYVGAGSLFGPIAWCLGPLLLRAVLPVVLVARGHSLLPMGANLIGALAMTGLYFALVPTFGTDGALVATAIGFSTPALVFVAFCAALGFIRLARDVVRPGIATAAAAAVHLLIAPASLGLATLAALTIMALLARYLGIFTAAERELLAHLVRRR